jgi:hypothetical protein
MNTPAPTALGTLAFYSDFDDFGAWKSALQAQLPQLEVIHCSEIARPQDIHYALVWKPPAGFFDAMTHLRMIVNLGAGVDSLVSRQDLPPNIPITRITDPHMAQMMAGYVLFAALRHARDIPFFEQAQRRRRKCPSPCWAWASWAPGRPASCSARASGSWAGRAAPRTSRAWNAFAACRRWTG